MSDETQKPVIQPMRWRFTAPPGMRLIPGYEPGLGVLTHGPGFVELWFAPEHIEQALEWLKTQVVICEQMAAMARKVKEQKVTVVSVTPNKHDAYSEDDPPSFFNRKP